MPPAPVTPAPVTACCLDVASDSIPLTASHHGAGAYLASRTPNASSKVPPVWLQGFKHYPGGVNYFDVHSPTFSTLYSQVFWKGLPPVPIPEEVVSRYPLLLPSHSPPSPSYPHQPPVTLHVTASNTNLASLYCTLTGFCLPTYSNAALPPLCCTPLPFPGSCQSVRLKPVR